MRFFEQVIALGVLRLSNAYPEKRQVPADPTGVTTISSPDGATIRYKQPGKDGVCETTEGV